MLDHAEPAVRITLNRRDRRNALSLELMDELAEVLTGEPISAATALDWGLVNRVVPAAELDAAVGELVLTKSVMATRSMAADAQEGISAFLEKRPPEWTSE